ncbi:hypothetical protein IV203_016371 [Nitzschia inconspicua]|uniref:Uncharacterized protein n=1 Tax=Nitzschia inconspicua TaxID=303405 RepID=A0A9K3K4G4_9STRA|nr:hypothetical protein IV203_017426 [Nitzschia inconspicua]KAG7347666.1 hypothetical protein IV203_016371 [Nitzschia inconspicua]
MPSTTNLEGDPSNDVRKGKKRRSKKLRSKKTKKTDDGTNCEKSSQHGNAPLTKVREDEEPTENKPLVRNHRSKKMKDSRKDGTVDGSLEKKNKRRREKAAQLGLSSQPLHLCSTPVGNQSSTKPATVKTAGHQSRNQRAVNDNFLLARKNERRKRSTSKNKPKEQKTERVEEHFITSKETKKDWAKLRVSNESFRRGQSSRIESKRLRSENSVDELRKSEKQREKEYDLVYESSVERSTAQQSILTKRLQPKASSSVVEDSISTHCMVRGGDAEKEQIGKGKKARRKSTGETRKIGARSHGRQVLGEVPSSHNSQLALKKESMTSKSSSSKKISKRTSEKNGAKRNRPSCGISSSEAAVGTREDKKDDYIDIHASSVGVGEEKKNSSIVIHASDINPVANANSRRSQMLSVSSKPWRSRRWLKPRISAINRSSKSVVEDAGPIPVEKRHSKSSSIFDTSSSDCITAKRPSSDRSSDKSHSDSNASRQPTQWYIRLDTEEIRDDPEDRMMEMTFFESVEITKV